MAKAKKPQEIEYRLIIAPQYNERKQVPTTLVTIETAKAFASFRYELSVKETEKGKRLHYKILGLKAPQLDLPSSGPARFVREYEAFKGKYELVIESLDGTENAFEISATQKSVTLIKSPKTPFIEVVVA
jgi:hypothetical protein